MVLLHTNKDRRIPWAGPLGATVLALLAGCGRYELTFNEQPIRSPAKLATDYEIPDPALRDCIAQTISDQRIDRIERLQRLTCSNAGITSVTGIDSFVGLEILGLGNNALTTITPLLALPSLVQLDLSGNPGLECSGLEPLTARGLAMKLPEHCQ